MSTVVVTGIAWEVRVPASSTLAKYGLPLAAWIEMVCRFEGACWICRKVPRTGRLVIDHAHVAGWKKLVPEVRVQFVRGLACTTCNHFVLTRYGTPEKFRGAAAYLEEYAARRGQPWRPR